MHCSDLFVRIATVTFDFLYLKMPRAAAVSTNEIIDSLAQVEIFQDSKGTLKPRSNKVWDDICALLENKIKRNILFLHVLKDRNGVLTKIKQQMNITANVNEVSVNRSKTIQSIDLLKVSQVILMESAMIIIIVQIYYLT